MKRAKKTDLPGILLSRFGVQVISLPYRGPVANVDEWTKHKTIHKEIADLIKPTTKKPCIKLF